VTSAVRQNRRLAGKLGFLQPTGSSLSADYVALPSILRRRIVAPSLDDEGARAQ
jgi:hypothetical protein